MLEFQSYEPADNNNIFYFAISLNVAHISKMLNAENKQIVNSKSILKQLTPRESALNVDIHDGKSFQVLLHLVK